MMENYLDKLGDQKMVDMILEWAAVKKPKAFRIGWTMDMQRLLTSGHSLTPRQRLGLINVIMGWNVDGKHWHKKGE